MTQVSIIGSDWQLDGGVTYPGARAEGLLMNVRMVNAVFEDTTHADFDPERLDPLPVKESNGRIIFTDGHTRAFAAFLHGISEIVVYWDEDELDWEAYEICVGWCDEVGIRNIADLSDRVVGPGEYEQLWYARCQTMRDELRMEREGRYHEW